MYAVYSNQDFGKGQTDSSSPRFSAKLPQTLRRTKTKPWLAKFPKWGRHHWGDCRFHGF